MAAKNKNEFRLAIGEIVIGIICPSEEYAESMSDYFGIENSEKTPDIKLTLNIVLHDDAIDIPDSLFTNKLIKGNNFTMGKNIITGYLNSEDGSGEINVKVGITIGPVTRIFEQILYQAFYSACKIKNHDSILVHSSGIIYKDYGFLFVGPSESGKSTVANISGEYHVLNDEICLIYNYNNKFYLCSTPFNGFYENKKPGYAELKAIFYLEHGTNHRINDIKESLAIKLLAKEIVPPIGLNETIISSTYIKMIDLAERLYKKIGVKKLEFLPDNGFWKEIDKIHFNI